MQETIKVIKNLQLCNEERFFEDDVILEGDIVLKNSKLVVNGMLWVRNTASEHTTISMEESKIKADLVLIDPVISKYKKSTIYGTKASSFSY